MGEVLTEFIGILAGGISEFATAVGSALNGAVTAMFLETSEAGVVGLSTFGGTVALFGGVALAVGFVTLIFHWLESIGN